MSIETITPQALKSQLSGPEEYAFLDVREHGQYGEGHPFFSVNAPYSQIETRAPVLVPRRQTLCFLMDDGDGVADLVAARMAEMGYDNLRVLEGGAPGWVAAGYTLFKGVNVLSKSFGELVEHACDTPSVSAEELRAMQAAKTPLVVLDGRSPREFHKMSLPGALSCPNAELPYRLPELVADEDTPIVINCAGRTRSIIGAQSLRNLGLKNPVFALRNGTQGWRLAGFDLRHGETPTEQPDLSPAGAQRAADRAADLIARFGLKTLDADAFDAMRADTSRTTYLFDVRTEAEYLAAHWSGARHAPGGQLVQATDEFFATRHARVVLSDDLGVRAASMAVWLMGMGHEVYLLAADARQGTEHGAEAQTEVNLPQSVDSSAIVAALAAGTKVYDASRGMSYRKAHVEGARWVTRARLTAEDAEGPVLVIGDRADLVAGVMQRLAELGATELTASVGDAKIWAEAGLDVVETPYIPAEEECIDFLFFVHDRHDDNLEAARQYLAWELNLLGQLDAQERAALDPLVATELEAL
ncbi:rhodanese-like domain-containing protein [Celeribacter sp. SCSIO 80788]|uniref:rhodanese-like domain-containing protein n=1 Tax=Celeribacter sp. SCSIO 80788 TaxID=3117013 RepID=UPI003DA493EC